MAKESNQAKAIRVLKAISSDNDFKPFRHPEFDEITQLKDVNYDDIKKSFKSLPSFGGLFGKNHYDIMIDRVKLIIKTASKTSNEKEEYSRLTEKPPILGFTRDKEVSLSSLIEFYNKIKKYNRNQELSKIAKANARDAEIQSSYQKIENARVAELKKSANAAKNAMRKEAQNKLYKEIQEAEQAEKKRIQEAEAKRIQEAEEAEQAEKERIKEAEQAEAKRIEDAGKLQIVKEISEKYETATKKGHNLETLMLFFGPFLSENPVYKGIFQTALSKGREIKHPDPKTQEKLEIDKVISQSAKIFHPDKHVSDTPIEKYKWEQLSRAMQSFKAEENFSILGGSRRTRRKSKRNTRSKSKRYVRKTRK